MDFKKDILPHIIAVGFIFVLFSIFFSPIYSGKQLVQGDIINSRGATQAITEHYEKYGERTLWTNSLFGGMPTFMVGTHHYGQLINNGFQKIMGILPHPINTFCLGAISFYILLLSMGASIPIAVLGAVGFSFSSYELITIEAGHNSKVYTTFLLPLLIAGVFMVYKEKYIKGVALSALSAALLIAGGHYQIIYYCTFGLVAISIYYIITDFKAGKTPVLAKKIGFIIIAAIIGIGANAGKLLCDFEYIPNSTRGKKELTDNKAGSKADAAMDYDYAFSWSQGILETSTILIPYYYGGSSNQKLDKKSSIYQAVKQNTRDNAQAKSISENAPLYWGNQPFTSGPVYFGAVFCFLFVLALYSWDSKLKYILIGNVVFLTMIAWGGNFKMLNYFLFDYFPGMNKFRAVAMALSVAQLFFTIIAAMGVHHFIESVEESKKQKLLFKSAGITLGITALLIIIGVSQNFIGSVDQQLSKWPAWLVDALHEDRKALLISDGIRSIILIAIGTIILYLIHLKKLTYQMGTGALIVICLFDLWSVNKRYVYEDKFKKKAIESNFSASAASEFILKDKDYNRVFNISSNTFNENITSYYHNSVGGYRPAKMQRYQDLIERRLNPEKGILVNALKQTQNEAAFNAQLFPKLSTLNMLNTKYIIYNPNAKPLINNSALGNAWFVNTVNSVTNANEEMDFISQKDFDPSKTAVVNKEQFDVSKESFSGTGNIKLTEYRADLLTYEVDASDNSFIVFSDVFYPNGWNVTIDDKPAEFVRANYILRGLEVPKGKHTISCSFKPSVYATGNTISLIASVALLLLIGFGIFMEMKRAKKMEDAQ